MKEGTRINGFYPYQQKLLPSVTKILGFAGSAEGLMRWACELGGIGVLWSLRALKTREEFHDLLESGSIIEWAKERAIKSLEDEQGRVQGFGKRVHFGIESLLLGRPIDMKDWLDSEKEALKTFEEFNREIGFMPDLVEDFLYSLIHRFAGRVDMISEISEKQAMAIKPYLLKSSETIQPGTLVIDYKTGSFYHDAHAMQLAAYKQGCLETFDYEPSGGLVINIARENPKQIKCFYYSKEYLDEAFTKGFIPIKNGWEYAGSPKWYRKEINASLH